MSLLLNMLKHDTRSTTGSNLRNILLLTGKHKIEDLNYSDVDNYTYAPVEAEDLWKINMVREIVDVKAGQQNVDNFSEEELEEISNFLCTT